MTGVMFFMLTIFGLTMSCNSGQQKNHMFTTDNTTETKFETTDFICDTIYPNRGYKITLIKFDTIVSEYDTTHNTVFALRKHNKILFLDSIHNAYQNVEFEDFNGDKVKDIKIQNMSSARSNWTYSLYLVDTINDKVRKVNGFENIPNPRYLPEYDIVDNYVLSGKNWTGFYKIQGDTIVDFNIQIEDDLSDSSLYEQEHENAIKRIMETIRNSH